ncbi:hypothetical protein LRQ11_27960, partial [Pseudomonas sp. MAFF 311095]|uniref:hypothetical protein n=1 Tax=Pseudomonas petroselini TaxID=2899822 RepID=UPI0020B25E66
RSDGQFNFAGFAKTHTRGCSGTDSIVDAAIGEAHEQIACRQRSRKAVGRDNAYRRTFENLHAGRDRQIVDVPDLISAGGCRV